MVIKDINKVGQYMPNPDRVDVLFYFLNDSTISKGDSPYPA